MADSRSRGRKIAGIVIRLAVAVGLIAWLVGSGKLKPSDIASALTQRPGWVAAAAVLYAVATFIGMIRWWVLLAAQGVRLRAWDVVHLSFIGFVFSSYIPGSVSGDPVKAYYVSRETHKKTGAVMSVLLDRVLGLSMFVTTAAVGLAIWLISGGLESIDEAMRPKVQVLAWAVFAIDAMFLLGFAVLWSRSLRHNELFNRFLGRLPLSGTVRRVYDAVFVYRDRPGHVAVAVVLAFLLLVPIILSQYCCGAAVGEERQSVGSYFFLGSIGVVVNAIPLGPMGIGSGEAGYDVLFGAFGSEEGKGAALIAMLHILMFVWNQIGWIFYFRGRDKYRAAFDAGSAEGVAAGGEIE